MSDSLQPIACSMPGLPVHQELLSLLKLMSIELVMPSHHLILWQPLFLIPSIFPSIRDFSNESSVHIRWLKYWSFSFSISPSSEYSRLISFRIERLTLFVTSWTVAHRLLCPWIYPGKNTGVGSHFLYQRIFLIQGSKQLFTNVGILNTERFLHSDFFFKAVTRHTCNILLF